MLTLLFTIILDSSHFEIYVESIAGVEEQVFQE